MLFKVLLAAPYPALTPAPKAPSSEERVLALDVVGEPAHFEQLAAMPRA